MNTRLVLALLVASAAIAAARKAVTCTLPPRRILQIPGAGGLGLGYYGTSEIGKPNSEYVLAVSYQHGMYEDPDVHYCAILGAMKMKYPNGNSSILLISPHFQDGDEHTGEIYWWGQNWNMGDNSSSEPSVSSFSIYDHMVSVLSDKTIYPNLNRIVLVGHSAGGQTMVRYALGTRTPEPEGGLRLVSSNPSTFPYLDTARPVDPSDPDTKFAKPSSSQIAKCPYYNEWRYGLDGLNEYMTNAGVEESIERWAKRDVVYLLGTADTCNEYIDPTCDSHGLDKGCEAMIQGRWRYERGCAWMRYLENFYGKKVHTQADVPDVSHDETKMVQNKVAVEVFFGSN